MLLKYTVDWYITYSKLISCASTREMSSKSTLVRHTIFCLYCNDTVAYEYVYDLPLLNTWLINYANIITKSCTVHLLVTEAYMSLTLMISISAVSAGVGVLIYDQ